MNRRYFLLAFAAIAFAAGTIAAAEPAPEASSTATEALVRRCLPAYVFIGGGSGAIISPDGYVITNAHVTRNSKRWKLRTGAGEYHNATVIGSSPGTDLCLLKIDDAKDLPHLPLGNSDELRIGDVVIAIGNPFALGSIDGKATVTAGVVSALHVDRPHAYDAIQTDTPINPGNSGGPLINLKGELIGVNAQIQTRFGLRQNTGAGYAISSNQVSRFLPALKDAGGIEVKAGKIGGIVLGTAPEEPAVIKEVKPESAAAEAGLQKGDIICAIDGAIIENVRDYQGALGRYPIDAQVTLKVRRGEPPDEHEFKMTITKFGRAHIGFKFELKSPNSMRIEAVEPGSPAEKAGMKPGDVIAGIGNMPLRNRKAYYTILPRLTPGTTVPFVVRRGTQNVALSLTIGEAD